MSELTLQWFEAGQCRTHQIVEGQPTLVSGVFRIGRDPGRCDLVLPERSVSGLHVEIIFRTNYHQVAVRNLRPKNPPLVDGFQLVDGEAPLHLGSRIQLGRLELLVQALHFSSLTPQSSPPRPGESYGLQCPNPQCGKVLAYSQEILQQGCPWCGFSLAAANSVVIAPPA